MSIEITTPALLFPAVTLLLLAYTNRFLVLAQLLRGLGEKEREQGCKKFEKQIENLQKRIELIKYMQSFGVMSIIFCTMSMLAIFLKHQHLGDIIFGISLVAMMLSLVFTLIEVAMSSEALNIELEDIKHAKS